MSDLWSWGAPKGKGASRTPRAPKQQALSVMPEVPETMWRIPEDLPDLSGAKVICFDCETYDPDIKNGPGFVRGKAHVVGLAIGTDDGYRGYFPIRHELGGNLNPAAVMRWAQKELGRSNQLKIGHNVIYDMEALACEGVMVKGPIYDTMLAEPLLDENKKSYSLDATAMTHLGEHKVDSALYKWSARAYGGEAGRRQAANIYRCPVSLVGLYAEGDVDLPLRIWEKQRTALEADGLLDLFKLECSLLPLFLQLRQNGVRVDIARAETLQAELKGRIIQQQKHIRGIVGMDIDVWAASSVEKAFKKAGIAYGHTEKGAASFTNSFFDTCKEPLAVHIREQRKAEKFLGTFIEGYILNNNVNGRIHTQFHALRSDEGGTVSGRMSSSCPNLQNIPSRDNEMGPRIREMFIPEDGMQWCCADYSQIEPRLLLHYASGEVATDMRSAYAHDKSTDFYNQVMEICGVSRRQSKGLSLGMMYSMGQAKLAASLGLTQEQAAPLFNKYHDGVPFVKELQQQTTQAAMHRGWVKTLLGRRSRFNLWEPKGYNESRNSLPLPHEEALAKWGDVKRAGTHKALNRVIQGGAADIFKAGLAKAHAAGVFSVLVPHLLVHDEIDVSVPNTKEAEEALEVLIHSLETAVPLKLPLQVEYNLGGDWYAAK